MNCREAQSCVQPFLSHELDVGKLDAYLKHLKTCSSCREDLDIYFMALVGLKLLDEDPDARETADLSGALRRELEEVAAYLKLRKGLTSLRRAAYAVSLAALVACALLFYSIL